MLTVTVTVTVRLKKTLRKKIDETSLAVTITNTAVTDKLA